RWHERRTAHHPAAACDEGRQRAGDNEPVTGRGIDIERQRAGGAEETLQYLPCDEVAACPRRHIDRCWRCGCASIRNHKMRPVADERTRYRAVASPDGRRWRLTTGEHRSHTSGEADVALLYSRCEIERLRAARRQQCG